MLLVGDLQSGALTALFGRYSLQISKVAEHVPIPGSYWGEHEAGLIGTELYVRDATPVHSALHEGAHFVCMDAERRVQLHRDAGGDHAEENAVCYLQILLADHIVGTSRARILADMDAWGYTFRLGSARAWFESDAEDARTWLQSHSIIDDAGHPTWRLR